MDPRLAEPPRPLSPPREARLLDDRLAAWSLDEPPGPRSLSPPRELRQERRPLVLGKNFGPSSSKAAANSVAGREPDEMCQLYPCLAEEVKAIEKEHPGLFKREFLMIDDCKARALEEEIRKQKLSQMRLRVEVTKTLLDLAE